jgi:hypothetical protein
LRLNLVTDLDPAGAFVTTAYHSAIRLYDGSVLLSGGNPARTECELPSGTRVETTFCALPQLAIYETTGDGRGVERRAGVPRLRIPRYGHATTRLLDNAVLFTGGVTINDQTEPLIVDEAELYSPRRGGEELTEDYTATVPGGRGPGVTARECEIHAVSSQ